LCWKCYRRRLFRTIDTEELLWVCDSCGAVRDLTDDIHND
jgi:hypothetical protein